MKPLNQKEINQRFWQFALLLVITIIIVIGVVFVNFRYPGVVIGKLKDVAIKQSGKIDSLKSDTARLYSRTRENRVTNDLLMNTSNNLIQKLYDYFKEKEISKRSLIRSKFMNEKNEKSYKFPNYKNQLDSIYANILGIVDVKDEMEKVEDEMEKVGKQLEDAEKDKDKTQKALEDCRNSRSNQNGY